MAGRHVLHHQPALCHLGCCYGGKVSIFPVQFDTNIAVGDDRADQLSRLNRHISGCKVLVGRAAPCLNPVNSRQHRAPPSKLRESLYPSILRIRLLITNKELLIGSNSMCV